MMRSKTPPRPIRVRPRVRDEDRKRAAQACWRCRDRKSRCIVVRRKNEKTVCQRCLKDGRECIFGRHPSESSPTGDDGARRLSQSWHPETFLPIPVSPRTKQPNRKRSSVQSADFAEPRVHNRPTAGHLVVKDPHRTHYVGEVSNGTFITSVQDAVAESPVEIRRDISSDFFNPGESGGGVDAELLHGALSVFPPKAISNFLVSTFFHTVEANYFYFDREEFTMRLDKCYEQLPGVPSDLDANFLCLVLMVFAMGSQFAELQAPSPAKPPLPTSKHGPGMMFYNKARTLLSDVITQYSLESIQVCFLIGLFLLPSNISDLSYIYHGMALKMAISAGLHRQVGNTNLSPRVLHVRNRLWWSLFTSERRLTIILDRPESIREEDTDTPIPIFCEELDGPGAQENIANLQSSIKFTKIFNEAVNIGKFRDFVDAEAEADVVAVRYKLEAWLNDLPPRLQIANLDPQGKSFRGAVHLHMNSNQMIIYMGRAALLRRVHNRLHEKPPDSAVDMPPDVCASEHEEVLIRDTVASAYKIIDLVRFLSDNKKLARFSFTDMHCCTTAAIIVIVQEVLSPHPLYASAIPVILSAMKHMSTGCQTAKHGLRLVQNLEAVVSATLDARVDKPLYGSTQALHTHALHSADGYQEWESWITGANGPGSAKNVQTSPSVVRTDYKAAPTGFGPFGSQDEQFSGPGLNAGSLHASQVPVESFLGTNIYDWQDDWNSLGLSGFEGLEFPNL